MPSPTRPKPHLVASLTAALLTMASPAHAAPPPIAAADPFASFELPDEWESRFWASPNVKALLKLPPRQVAELVPVQGGIRFCRCPACDAPEGDDPLDWSVEKPKELKCRRCGVVVPNEKVPKPEKDKKEPPEEAIEVSPGVVHHYPYHEVEPEHQRYLGERLYLAAKRDDRAREFLARAALYAAVRYHEQPAGRKEPALARLSAVILVRFAQVYPAYATHYDQPGSPKFFDKADLGPPYRRRYQTGKWTWTACQEVPLNLVIAYARLRTDPALAEAGRLLGESDPTRRVEFGLLRASAEFTRRQTDEADEASLHVDRGLLAVGRLLRDPELVHDAVIRLEAFAARGFYHDGFWREGTLTSHRRVLAQLDGWIDRLLSSHADPAALAAGATRATAEVPMLALAHNAASTVLRDGSDPEVRQATWPAPTMPQGPMRAPRLLGGLGVARLALGKGEDALDVELRGLDAFGPDHIQRQALRLAVGGRAVLGDLDEYAGVASGFDHASASRNTVIVDGLNQRESISSAREPAPGGGFLFFAADPDFQVVTLDDPLAYARSTTRYRQTVVTSAGARSRYALAVFEVRGGRKHDQFFHAPAGSAARWRLSVIEAAPPASLLPSDLPFVATAKAEEGRWFVQSYGEFAPRSRALIDRPAQAWTAGPDGEPVGVRLHLLGDLPMTAVTATSPDPTLPAPSVRRPGDESGRGSLLLRRHSADGSTLETTFVTLLEPVAHPIPPLSRAGRVASPPGTVVVLVETADGPEHLVINLSPGTPRHVTLADGRALLTDGLAVRVTASGLTLAGGTFADVGGRVVRQSPAAGRVTASSRAAGPEARGWFQADAPLPDPDSLAGRTMLIRHGDGTTRGWTLLRVENTQDAARLYVREEPGFLVDPETGAARYYQFPRTSNPGPHRFRISRVARSGVGTG